MKYNKPVSQEFQIASMCKDMNWTYNDYMDSPNWLIDHLIALNMANEMYNKSINKNKK